MKEQQEKKNNQKEQKQNFETKKKNFFKLLEKKAVEFGTNALKSGIVNFATSKAVEFEEKIKTEIEKKTKKQIQNALKVLFIVLGSLFLLYGLIEIILEKLQCDTLTNLVFGSLLFIVGIIFHFAHKR